MDPVVDKGSEPKIEVEEPPRKATRIRKPKSPAQLKTVIIEKTKAKPPAAEKAPVTGRWSPQVANALFKAAGQSKINPGMSMEEVKKMVAGSKR